MAARFTKLTVSGLISGASRKARETVEILRPVFSAISRIFGMAALSFAGNCARKYNVRVCKVDQLSKNNPQIRH